MEKQNWREQFDDHSFLVNTHMGSVNVINLDRAKRYTTEIIEKLIEDIPDNGIFPATYERPPLVSQLLKQDLRDKWL